MESIIRVNVPRDFFLLTFGEYICLESRPLKPKNSTYQGLYFTWKMSRQRIWYLLHGTSM
jgi:hypothetical protein